jgi:hypothetical protein
MAFKTVSPATVRAYFAAQGTPIPAAGRISDKDAETYNKANKGRPYVPNAYKGEAITVKAKPAKGRTVTRKVYVSEVREAAVKAGVQVGARGRLPQPVLSAYVLGDLPSLASA